MKARLMKYQNGKRKTESKLQWEKTMELKSNINDWLSKTHNISVKQVDFSRDWRQYK
jgi:hypothetical protein